MRYKYEIIVGTEFDKDKMRIYSYDIKFTLIEVASVFGGYSITDQVGGYIMSSDGSLVQENSINLTILSETERDAEIRAIAHELKAELRQESVLVVKTEIKGDFL